MPELYCVSKKFLLGLIVVMSLSGCKNPFYWVVPARRVFASVPAAKKIFELDKDGLRSTWGQVWFDVAPGRMAYSTVRKELLVLLPEARTMAVVAPNTYQILDRMATTGKSSDVAVSSDGNWAYVVNPEEKTVVRLDLRGRKVDKPLTYASSTFAPIAVATHPSKPDDAYVLSASGSISVIRGGVQDAFTAVLSGAVRPLRIVAGTQQDLFVTDIGGTSIFRLTDPEAPKVQKIDLGTTGPSGLAAAPDGTLYVTIPAGNKVLKVVGGVPTTYATGGQSPGAVVADSTGVYIANEGSNQIVGMIIQAGKLYDPREIDILPGPPLDLASVE